MDNEQKENMENIGTFVGFVLLSCADWDKAQLINDLKEKWDIKAEEDENKSDDAFVFSVGNMIAAASIMPSPVPNNEAEKNASNNYMWPEAVNVTKKHKAHIMVAVVGKEADLLERGKLYIKVVAACCRQKNAIGVYTSGTVFEPSFYEGFADMIKENELPIYNWIWFGLYNGENGICAYTYGMDVFGKNEMEILNANAQPDEVRDFLANIVSYVLEQDVTLQDGETIGFSEEDIHAITYGDGVSLPGMTLKIKY